MKIDELLLSDGKIDRFSNSMDIALTPKVRRVRVKQLLKDQIEKIKNNLPSFEEIRLKIADCQFGGMEVPQLREWLKENLLIK